MCVLVCGLVRREKKGKVSIYMRIPFDLIRIYPLRSSFQSTFPQFRPTKRHRSVQIGTKLEKSTLFFCLAKTRLKFTVAFVCLQDYKLKHMAEMQQSVVGDSDARQQLGSQVVQWEENLERLHCEQFRLRCYMASLQSGELPNPKVSHVIIIVACSVSTANCDTVFPSRLRIPEIRSFSARNTRKQELNSYVCALPCTYRKQTATCRRFPREQGPCL